MAEANDSAFKTTDTKEHNGIAGKQDHNLNPELGTQTEISFTDGITSSKSKTEDSGSSDTSNSETDDRPGTSSDSRSGKIQVDAVHPFLEYRSKRRKISVSTSTEEDKKDLCFCEQCKSYFLKLLPDKIEHFVNIHHKPDDKCVYCNGPVYYFLYNKKRDVYHKCHKDHVESLSQDTVSKNNNNDDSSNKNDATTDR